MKTSGPDPADTEAEAAFTAAVARIRASGVLGESGRLLELFTFLADRGASAEAASQAEIAETVFGQAPSGDSDDATVRVYIHRLRKRLDEYYAENGEADLAARLVIPAGTYALRLREGAYVNQAPEQRRLPGARAIAAAAVIFLFIAAAGFLLGRMGDGGRAAPVNAIWQPFVESGRPVVVVMGDYYVFAEYNRFNPEEGRLIRDFQIDSRTDLARAQEADPERYEMAVDMGLNYLPFSSAYGLQALMPVLAQNRYPVAVIPASQVNSDTFRFFNVVYVGLISGMGLLEDVNFMSSSFAVGENYDDLVDTEEGRTYTSGEALSLSSAQYYRDYGYVSVFREPGGALVAVVAGARDTGLRGLSSVVASPDLPPELARLVRQGNDGGFEALFEITGQQGADLSSRLAASRARPVAH